MKIKKHTCKKIIFAVIAFLFISSVGVFFIFSIARAVYTYTPMENIPGFENAATDFPNYILSITKFAIWAVGIAALFMITIGGFMYMTSAGNTSRMDSAKKVIFDAVIGLIVALSAWLLLFVINPDLVKVNISLKAVPPAAAPAPPTKPPIGPGVTFDNNQNKFSPVMTTFVSCLQNFFPALQINSIADSDIPSRCNPTDPKETFNDDNNCVHSKYSCHYGGSNGSCVAKGSYAVDIGLGTNGKELAAAAASCGGKLGNYDTTAKCILNEGGTHHHISIGAWYGCKCDTGVKTCASQK